MRKKFIAAFFCTDEYVSCTNDYSTLETVRLANVEHFCHNK